MRVTNFPACCRGKSSLSMKQTAKPISIHNHIKGSETEERLSTTTVVWIIELLPFERPRTKAPSECMLTFSGFMIEWQQKMCEMRWKGKSQNPRGSLAFKFYVAIPLRKRKKRHQQLHAEWKRPAKRQLEGFPSLASEHINRNCGNDYAKSEKISVERGMDVRFYWLFPAINFQMEIKWLEKESRRQGKVIFKSFVRELIILKSNFWVLNVYTKVEET